MAEDKAINPGKLLEYRRKRTVDLPEPMQGWAIVQLIEVDERTTGGIYIPTAGTTGMDIVPDDQKRKIYKLRVVKAAEEYIPLGSITPKPVPFSKGDYLLGSKQMNIVDENTPFPVMLPEGHISVEIRTISGWLPCPVEERAPKPGLNS